jgi:hypothetical protein
MNLTPTEAEEALAAIQHVTQKTRHAIANSGAHIFLILTGSVWLIGFLANQFLPASMLGYIWGGISVLGSAAGILLGRRTGPRVRGPATSIAAKRAITFWLLLALYAVATIAVARPAEGEQVTMFIVLFIMIGQLSMGLLLSFSAVWWAIPITALALLGYFLLPGIFYLWMGLLVGGGMIALGLYIRARW